MTMKTLAFLTVLMLGLLPGSGVADKEGRGPEGKGVAEIDGDAEDLYGMEYGPEGLSFQVRSTGCTEKEDFRVAKFQESEAAVANLLLIRTTPDFCDAYVPFGEWISFDYRELKLEEGQSFTVLNPNATNLVREGFE
jgi:hypothetical protein